jgi:hypothetical protein
MITKRIAELADRKTLNKGYSKPFDSLLFQAFYKRLTNLYTEGKLLGTLGIVPIETIDEDNILFELRTKTETILFSTGHFKEIPRMTHKEIYRKLYPKSVAPDTNESYCMEYTPTREELAEVKMKLADSPAWILDKHAYRHAESLLSLSNVEKQKSRKTIKVPDLEKGMHFNCREV